jgi:uncharacterized membrane protein YphA (DoxX/SURF4 family)
VLVIARLLLAYLFFVNIWWKTPPTFGCSNDFAFATVAADGGIQTDKTTGLCYYLSLESYYAPKERKILAVDAVIYGGPSFGINISPLAQLNAAFIDEVVKPNIRWFGYLVWGGELFIAITLFFGIVTRLGSLLAIAISAQLMIGLANIPSPFEWEWSYNLMVILSLVLFAFAPGRTLGLDTLLRRWLRPAAVRGNLLARLGLLLT